MEKVSLTYFVDFVMKSGTPKLTVVRKFKERDDYDPQTDFYKKIRQGIVRLHREGKPKTELDSLIAGLSDEKKQNAYPEIVSGYKKFLGSKKVKWFEPPQGDWTAGGLKVSVNPELGLEINGQPFVLKLYFKDEALQKKRAEIVAHMMNVVLGPMSPSAAAFVVLDVRRGKSVQPPVPVAGHDALLAGEAASFATMFANL
ncbi:MAG: hypothetical protein ABJA82_07550 [Myxococcales bacterium]